MIIASAYPQNIRQTYMDAASTLRMPFWDWAYNATVPEAVNARTVRVTTPKGLETMKNPLVSYEFQGTPPPSGFSNDRTVCPPYLLFLSQNSFLLTARFFF
jgi:tyrosinase